MPFFTLRNTFFGFVAINLILVFLYNRSVPSFPEKGKISFNLPCFETQGRLIESISLSSQENISTPESLNLQIPPPQDTKQDEIIASYEKQIASLKLQLQQAKDVTLKHKEAKDQLRNFTLGLKKDYELLFSRYKAHTVTLNYTKTILTDISPFAKLDIYSNKMPLQYYNFKDNGRLINGAIYSGAKHNPFYCVAVDLYNFYNPENIFKNMNFMTDYSFDESLIRKEVMTKIGNDVMPDLSMRHSDPRKPKYDLPVNATMTFLKKAMIHSAYEIHKELACVSQMYNHIPGSGVIARKDLLVEATKFDFIKVFLPTHFLLSKYTAKFIDRPQCLHGSFFPKSYRLNDKQECKEFFSYINSKQYHLNKKLDPIQFLLKLGNGPHRAMGLSIFDEDLENQVSAKYQNGKRCGEETKSFVAQQYISNPLVLDKNNKFDFRIYMLVASVDPLIVYYHDGFLRVSLSEYDKHSKQKNVHFTNTHLSKKIFQEAGENDFYDGMDEDELRDYQMWSMEELQEYLLETHQIEDKNWLNNYLRPKFKEAFIHLARMAEDSLYKTSSVFEMYGLDFVIDKDMNLWFIECNPSPQLVGTTQKKTDFIIKLITDLFEIQYAYLRSRMKRVYGLIKNMQDREFMGQNINYPELRREFDILNTNRLEPEFSISKTNSFSLILDKNLDGENAYFGHLSKECID